MMEQVQTQTQQTVQQTPVFYAIDMDDVLSFNGEAGESGPCPLPEEADDPDLRRAMLAMPVGNTMTIGGGADPWLMIVRVQ